MAGPWEKYRQQPQGGIPMAPAAQTRLNNDTANIGSQIESRGFSNAQAAASTGKTVVDTRQAQLDLENAIRSRAQGTVVNDEFTNMMRNQLLAVQDAKGLTHRRSTGAIGELIGQPGDQGSYDLADLPLLGGLVYGGSDRSRLQTNTATIKAGARFNMMDMLKQRAQAAGSSGTGLGATAIPEFEALGQANFNLDSLAGGPVEVNRQLGKAEDALLRRYAAATLPLDTVMKMQNMKPEQRQGILAAATDAARKEYEAGFKPPKPVSGPTDAMRAAAIAELKRRGKM
jgi:hypothetical protein